MDVGSKAADAFVTDAVACQGQLQQRREVVQMRCNACHTLISYAVSIEHQLLQGSESRHKTWQVFDVLSTQVAVCEV